MSRAPFRGDEQLLGNQCGPEPHLWEMSQNLCCSIPSLGSHRRAKPASLRLSGGWALGWSLPEGGGSVKYISTTPEVTGGGEQDGGGQRLDTPPLPHTPCRMSGTESKPRLRKMLMLPEGLSWHFKCTADGCVNCCSPSGGHVGYVCTAHQYYKWFLSTLQILFQGLSY